VKISLSNEAKGAIRFRVTNRQVIATKELEYGRSTRLRQS
jgi:hypothetical protein